MQRSKLRIVERISASEGILVVAESADVVVVRRRLDGGALRLSKVGSLILVLLDTTRWKLLNGPVAKATGNKYLNTSGMTGRGRSSCTCYVGNFYQ